MEVSFPAFAHRVTVLGSTRNMVATSAGVSSGSASGVRADIRAASLSGADQLGLLRPIVPVGVGDPKWFNRAMLYVGVVDYAQTDRLRAGSSFPSERCFPAVIGHPFYGFRSAGLTRPYEQASRPRA